MMNDFNEDLSLLLWSDCKIDDAGRFRIEGPCLDKKSVKNLLVSLPYILRVLGTIERQAAKDADVFTDLAVIRDMARMALARADGKFHQTGQCLYRFPRREPS